MSGSNRLRWSGLAALVGSVLTGIVNVVEFVTFGEMAGSGAITTSTWGLVHVLFLVGIALMLLGLVGLYARQAEQARALGLIAFLIAFAGTFLVGGLIWAEAFLAPAVAGAAPDVYDALEPSGSLGTGFFVSFILLYLGWLLFGLASLQAGVFSRVAALLLMVGTVLALIFGVVEIPAASIILDVVWLAGIAWLGFALWSEKPMMATAPAMS